jgi:hypothetical protein
MLTLTNSRLILSRGAVRIGLVCMDSSCAGSIELTVTVKVRHRRGGRITARREKLLLGRGTYSLVAGHSTKVDIRMRDAAMHTLVASRRRRFSVEVLASLLGAEPVRRALSLREIRHRRY